MGENMFDRARLTLYDSIRKSQTISSIILAYIHSCSFGSGIVGFRKTKRNYYGLLILIGMLLFSNACTTITNSFGNTKNWDWPLSSRGISALKEGENLPDGLQIMTGRSLGFKRTIIEFKFANEFTIQKYDYSYRKNSISRFFFGQNKKNTSKPHALSVDFARSLLIETSKAIETPESDEVICLDGPIYFAVVRQNGKVKHGYLYWCGHPEIDDLVCKISSGEPCIRQ